MDSDETSHGGNIALSGFKDVDGATVSIVKKVVGSFVEKLTDHGNEFQGIRITLKSIHKREKSELYEIHAHLRTLKKTFSSEVVDRNLFVALDAVLKKVEHELDHYLNSHR